LTAKVRIILAALILTVFLAPAGAGAPDLAPSPPITAGPIITDTAVPIAAGHFAVEPYWAFSFVQGNFTPSWRRTSAGGDFTAFVTVLHLVYGPREDMEIYTNIPAIQNWASRVDHPVAGNRSADFGGLGDITFVCKYQLFTETERRPTVTPFLSVVFPTGHASGLNPGRLGMDDLGGGAFSFFGGLLLSKWLSPFYLYANVSYGAPTKAPPQVSHCEFDPLLAPVMHRGQVTYNLAGEWVLSPRWVALLEFYSSWEVGPLIGRRASPPEALLGVLPGMELIISPRWNLEAGVALDLGGKNSTYNVTPIVTGTFNY
jgi:hypothetical protein